MSKKNTFIELKILEANSGNFSFGLSEFVWPRIVKCNVINLGFQKSSAPNIIEE